MGYIWREGILFATLALDILLDFLKTAALCCLILKYKVVKWKTCLEILKY